MKQAPEVEWVCCPGCQGEGEWRDSGEDTDCGGAEVYTCDECGGDGGWYENGSRRIRPDRPVVGAA